MMISYIFLLLASVSFFNNDYTLYKLDGSEANVNDLKKYELIVFYTNPNCCACVNKISEIIKQYEVQKLGIVAKPHITDMKNNSYFIGIKKLQQELKNKFGVTWADIYFDNSDIGCFNQLELINKNSLIQPVPALLININGEQFYYSYYELFNPADPNHLFLKSVFDKHFKK